MASTKKGLAQRVIQEAKTAAGWVPLSLRGLVLAAGAAAVLWYYGVLALDILLLVAAVAALVVLGVAALTTLGSALALRRRLARAVPVPLSERIETEAWMRTGYALPDWPIPWIELELRWEEPADVECRLLPAVEGGLLWEEIRAERRAFIEGVTRVIELRDVFGLTRVRLRDRRAVRSLILPNPGLLREPEVVATRAGGDGIPHPAGEPEGDRADIRRYAPGDSARDVLWKTFARTGLLMVRRPERSVEPARQVSAYLVADQGDEASAAAARVALESGALGAGWRFGADGAPEAARSLPDALRAVASSGSARGPTRLGSFLESAARGDPCVVFVPAHDGPWRAEASRQAERHGARLAFVLGTDGIARDERRSLWERLLLAADAGDASDERELRSLAAQLGAHGAMVRVLDRPSGRQLTAEGGALA